MLSSIKMRALPFLLVPLLGLAACDNPVEEEEHTEPGGVVILQEGTNTVLARSLGTGAFDQPLQLTVGQALEVEVKFLDAAAPNDLSRAFLPDEDEGESLAVEVVNPAVATFASHGDHGDFLGVAAGTTTAEVKLMHGGHSDFESGALTIVVTQ